MAETKFTQGPWHPGCITDSDSSCNCKHILCESYAGSVASVSVDNGLNIRDGGNDAPPLEEAKANAHLIAAAPDLYEACQAALNMVTTDQGFPNWDLLRAALKKARGEVS